MSGGCPLRPSPIHPRTILLVPPYSTPEHGGTSKITELDGSPGGEQGQPLTAPEVNPETIRFCKIRAKAMSGAETRTEAAMIWPIGFS